MIEEYVEWELTRRSPISGKDHTMKLRVTLAQLEAYKAGERVQYAFPQLSDDEREFIITGMTATDWDKVCPPPEE